MAIVERTETALIQLVRSVAKSEILSRFRRLPDHAVSTKTGPDDLVTEADLHAEAAIAAGVRLLLPEALIVGEEAAETHPEILDGLADAELSVIIDPVDGTWNFAKGLATFGVILAVARRGETVFGLLYDPVMDDWVRARRGGGAWFEAGDGTSRRLGFGDTLEGDLTGMLPILNYPRELRMHLAGGIPGFRPFSSLRCSCHEYRTLVTGGADFVLSSVLKPWDHAAGVLAVEEAGGAVGLLDGRRYNVSITSGGHLVAARSEAILDQVRASMTTVIEGAG